MSTFPDILCVSGSDIYPYREESMADIKKDPRGLLFMYEQPIARAKYIMGLDPTQGITGWSRGTRTTGDHKTDNGAIEIFRVDAVKEIQYRLSDSGERVPEIDPITKQPRTIYRDLQVAEFAAPCDAVEIARVANVLGRIYAGDEEDQCELVWEAWPGPGILTTQELLRLGYGNLWHWEYIDSVAEETNRMGWRSTRESQKLLWYRARRHLMERRAIIRSPFLLAEYANAEIDMDKMRARAAYGYHDDRFMAANLCFWAGHKWSYDAERTDEPVTTVKDLDYQRFAPTLGDHKSYKDWREDALSDWYD
jgi:hypothetical protein